jgi:hypothetical protein
MNVNFKTALMKPIKLFFAAAAVFAGVALQAAPAHAQQAGLTQVDAEILLLVDVSRSVDYDEFQLQREGYAREFENPKFFNEVIAKGPLKRIAVAMVYFSSPKDQAIAADYTLIDSPEAGKRFAQLIRGALPFGVKLEDAKKPNARAFSGTTAAGSALTFGFPTLFNNAFDSKYKAIVLSGDGAENDGAPTPKVRDEAISKGVTAIHALPIGSEALRNWFNKNVRSEKGFLVAAKDFPVLEQAIDEMLRKVVAQAHGAS